MTTLPSPTLPSPTLPPLPLIDGALFLDNSALSWFYHCPREWEYAFMHNLTAADHQAALNFGGAIHEALEAFYTDIHTTHKNNLVESMDEEVYLSPLREHFASHPQPEDNFRSPYHAEVCLRQYARLYRDDIKNMVIKVNPVSGKPMIEQSFAVLLGWFKHEYTHHGVHCVKIPVYYTGRIDLVILQNNRPWLLDHKTTFQFGNSFTRSMESIPQFPGYAWAYEQLYHERVAGFIVNGIRVRPPTKDAAYDEDLLFRITGKDSDYVRLPTYIDYDTTVAEWYRNTCAVVQQILDNHSTGYYPQNKNQCVTKYGMCQFYDVCACVPQARAQMLQGYGFVQNTFTPLNVPVPTHTA